MKVLLTSPKPITTGDVMMDFSSGDFDSIWGIALFSDTGDVGGSAVVNGGRVNVRFTSPNGTFGTNSGYPLMTFAMHISPNARPGSHTTLTLDATSWIADLFGASVPIEIKPSTVTVGGTVNISNVVPGGGPVAAGSVVSVRGMGFTGNTKVRADGIGVASVRVVSANEIQVKTKNSGTLDGAMFQVQNPDKSMDTYYSYLRGVPVGFSATPLLAATVPLFSIKSSSAAALTVSTSPDDTNSFTGIALQNPNSIDVTVTVGQNQLTLASGRRISLTLAELLGASPAVGTAVQITASQPIQMLGLVGNISQGVVQPVSLF
ncbi:MAG: hypothetical protein M3Z36_03010 [Acidobacteriota bacterium]|nr:hypothetical protein [Acidobacteriota bacterium]